MGLFAAICAFFPAQAETSAQMLPPDMVHSNEDARFLADVLSDFTPEPLWPDDALRDHAARYRLTISAISFVHAHELQVSIDVDGDGDARLRSEVWVRNKKVDESAFGLSEQRTSDFAAAVEASGLWRVNPEIWQLVGPSMCAHGREFILEKHDAAGYAISYGNAGCNSPKGMNRLVATMVALARRNDDEWFRVDE